MIKINNKQKAFALFLGLAALLLPTSAWAQAYDKEAAESYNGGAFYELIAYDTYLDELANVLKAVELNRGSATISGGSITNDDFGPSPLGSGIGILLAAGAGYAALRRKRSRKNTTLLLACLLLLGFTQCKKEQIEPQGGKVSITLNVNNGGKATDGAKVEVDPPQVYFETGDEILVAHDGIYVGTLTYTEYETGKYRFQGAITADVAEPRQKLYFYYLGNNQDDASLDAGSTTSCTVNISDQTGYPTLPVISFSASNEDFTGTGEYSAKLNNKCSLIKFNVITPSSNSPICITGMNNKVTVNFADRSTNDGFSYSKEGGGVIRMQPVSGTGTALDPVVLWAIVLPQDALVAGAEGSAYTDDFYVGARPAIPAITMDQYLNEDRTMTVSTLGWDGNLANVTNSSTEAFATARDGMTIYGTLGVNKKVSIAAGAEVTLSGVTINGTDNYSYSWAGLNCLGDATIILADGTTNTVKGFYQDYPGIHVSSGFTLTINGTGALTASSNGWGCGIGGGYKGDNTINCGNIIISGGTVTATGGGLAAGIGSGGNGCSCGTITISGGTVTATGGNYAAGIGSGYKESSCVAITISGGTVTATGGQNAAGIGSGSYPSSCGDITIENTVTRVTATKGSSAPNSIGAGDGGACGTVTIDDVADAIPSSTFTHFTSVLSGDDNVTWTLTHK